MNSLTVYAVIGVAVLISTTFGFAATLSTPPEFNRIGASDNLPVGSPSVNITGIDFIVEVSPEGVIETDGIIYNVGNEDPANTHTFSVCFIIEGPIGTFSPLPGTPPTCSTTTPILPNAILTSETVTFSPAMNVTDLFDLSVSVEELS